jgi:hypothetical protein
MLTPVLVCGVLCGGFVSPGRREGSAVFFRGLGTALLRAFPLHAIIFFAYEYTIKQIKHLDLMQPPLVPLPE